ncbi:MAG: hypothetical protein HBSAPP03_10910 [Phycisphaerae bacterium]|nr:MAG: hypothetical protein HBSAPP03_10910 [Phycisphaerae bacterium]
MSAATTDRGLRQRAVCWRDSGRASGRGFSLLDVLVSISIIAVLISLLLPAISKVNETARRVVCQSNIRQIGLGVIMYADVNHGELPPSQFVTMNGVARSDSPKQNMDMVRVGDPEVPGMYWDGLGVLFRQGYLDAPKVFYCPSHHGENPYRVYSSSWLDDEGDIVCNYHYRGSGPQGHRVNAAGVRVQTTRLYLIDPAQSSLIADGLRTQSDYNHWVGVNFFRADLTVHWFDDSARTLLLSLPETKDEVSSSQPVDAAWMMFDASANQAD